MLTQFSLQKRRVLTAGLTNKEPYLKGRQASWKNWIAQQETCTDVSPRPIAFYECKPKQKVKKLQLREMVKRILWYRSAFDMLSNPWRALRSLQLYPSSSAGFSHPSNARAQLSPQRNGRSGGCWRPSQTRQASIVLGCGPRTAQLLPAEAYYWGGRLTLMCPLLEDVAIQCIPWGKQSHRYIQVSLLSTPIHQEKNQPANPVPMKLQAWEVYIRYQYE